jgi:hypothetical protein
MKSYDHGYQLFCDNLVNFVDLKKCIECDYSQFIEKAIARVIALAYSIPEASPIRIKTCTSTWTPYQESELKRRYAYLFMIPT